MRDGVNLKNTFDDLKQSNHQMSIHSPTPDCMTQPLSSISSFTWIRTHNRWAIYNGRSWLASALICWSVHEGQGASLMSSVCSCRSSELWLDITYGENWPFGLLPIKPLCICYNWCTPTKACFGGQSETFKYLIRKIINVQDWSCILLSV